MQYQANRNSIPQIPEWQTSYQDHPQMLGLQPKHRFPIYPIPRYPLPRQFSQERCLSKESIHLNPAVFKSGTNEINYSENTFHINQTGENLCPYYGNKNNFAFSNPYLSKESLLPMNQSFLQENMVFHPFQRFQSNRRISNQPFKVQEGLARLTVPEQSRHIHSPCNNLSMPQLMSHNSRNVFQREHRGKSSYAETTNIRQSAFSNQHSAHGELLPLIQQGLQENVPIHSTQLYQGNRFFSQGLPETFNIASCPRRLPKLGHSAYFQTSWNKQGKPYQGNICDKPFAQRSFLKRHIRAHTNERPYQCHNCHKSFIQESVLKIHIRSHTNERPYKCNICHERFTQLGNLNRHIRLHKNERPYQCHICHKRFFQNPNLKRHILSH